MDKVFGLDSALKLGEDVYHIETFAEPKHFKVISQTYKSGARYTPTYYIQSIKLFEDGDDIGKVSLCL